MNKYQYLIRNAPQQALATFRQRIFDVALPQLQAGKPDRLKVSLTEAPPPRWTILPLQPNGLALISVWSETDPTPAAWRNGLAALGGNIAGYRVDESIPRDYDKTWQDGEPTPGVVLLTLMKQHPQLDHDAFIAEWHGRHTPMSFEIHPLWGYIRNVVDTAVVPDSPPFDGIVEEHFRTRADLLNPVRMFGGALRFAPNMLKVFRHANSFLDLKRCENYLLTEYIIQSQPGLPDYVSNSANPM